MMRPRFWEDTSGRLIPGSGCGEDLPTAGELPALIPYRKSDKWGLCDSGMRMVIPAIYDAEVGCFCERRAAVNLGGRWGFIDARGDMVVPGVYDEAGSFFKAQASVAVNGKHGLIDPFGNAVVPCIYDEAFYFREGLASVNLGGRWGFIDVGGKMVIPAIYDEAGSSTWLALSTSQSSSLVITALPDSPGGQVSSRSTVRPVLTPEIARGLL